ncbi:MAG: hypothetical protein KKB59_18955 [Spirochaetes bacterium]|nr:hypothetical protein [Spirochaetota bacterium]
MKKVLWVVFDRWKGMKVFIEEASAVKWIKMEKLADCKRVAADVEGPFKYVRELDQ